MTERKRLEESDVVAGREYTYVYAQAYPAYMNGAHVRVTQVFKGDGLTVAYDFWTDGGTTGSGTMHMDHARSVLVPKKPKPEKKTHYRQPGTESLKDAALALCCRMVPEDRIVSTASATCLDCLHIWDATVTRKELDDAKGS